MATEVSPGVFFLTREEGWAEFDKDARRRLGVSAEEFTKAFKNGDFKEKPGEPENVDAMTLSMYIP